MDTVLLVNTMGTMQRNTLLKTNDPGGLKNNYFLVEFSVDIHFGNEYSGKYEMKRLINQLKER